MLIKLAVCDDSLIELKLESAILKRYGEIRGEIELEIDTFSSSEDFIAMLKDGKIYDICVLDMLMPKHNGIDVGRVIREYSMSTAIIYITSYPDYALDAFGVFAEQYIIKPISAMKVYEVMDRILDRITTPAGGRFPVKTKEAVISLRLRDIVCVENAGRYMRVYTKDGAVTDSASMRTSFEKQVSGLLEKPEFVQTHKSFVANMMYFTAIGNSSISTNIGIAVPISRRHLAGVKTAYSEFFGHKLQKVKEI